jgi:hypothetical protein
LRKTLVLPASVIAVSAVAVAFILLPILSATNPPASGGGLFAVYHCIYGDTGCSTMVASWFLAIATAAAFTAAAVATRYAWRSFILETKVQLGQSQCLKHDKISADVVRYLPENGQLTRVQPPDFDPGQYYRHEHAFTALGRAAVIGAVVGVAFRFKDNRDYYSDSINLGHIQPHAETHVRIYTHPSHDNPNVVWSSAKYEGGTLPNGKTFFTTELSNGRVVKEVGNMFQQADQTGAH